VRASRALKFVLFSGVAAAMTAGVVVLVGSVATGSDQLLQSAESNQIVVQPGDTLWSITGGNPTEINAIVSANNLADPNLIYVGEVLQLPGGTPTVQGSEVSDPAPAPISLVATSSPVVPQSAFEACVIENESGGNPTAVNPISGAAGLYQFLPSTWAGYDGYPSAADAPPAVQQQYFDQVYAEDGTAPWAPYDGC
jgi:LysM repeat protein